MNNSKIYVTYTKTSQLNLAHSMRFAVECENKEQAEKVLRHLRSRSHVKNIRLNHTGRNLPCEAAVFFYNEYMALNN